MVFSTKNCAENVKKWNPLTTSKIKKAKPAKRAFLVEKMHRQMSRNISYQHQLLMHPQTQVWWTWHAHAVCTANIRIFSSTKKASSQKWCQPFCRDKFCKYRSDRDNIHVEKHIREFPDDDILNKNLCGKCKKMKPMDLFKNKKGETYKMCLSCREWAQVNNKERYIPTTALNFGDKNIDLWECKVCHDPYPHFEFVGSSKTCTSCTADAKNLERELQCPHETCIYRGYKEALRKHVSY